MECKSKTVGKPDRWELLGKYEEIVAGPRYWIVLDQGLRRTSNMSRYLPDATNRNGR